MSKENKKIRKLFKKYFIYYMLILLIPIIVISAGISYFMYSQNEEQINSYAESVVAILGNSIDETFNTIYAANELIINDDVLKYMYSKNESHYELYEYHNKLQNIKPVVSFLENIIVVDIDNSSEYIVSSDGTYTPEFFYNNIYYFTQDLKTLDIKANSSQIVQVAAEGKEMLAYILPGAHSGAINVFTIPDKFFDDTLLKNELGSSYVFFHIGENNILYSYTGNNIVADEILSNVDDEIGRVTIDNLHYTINTQSSKSTNLSYTVLTPITGVSGNMSSLMLIYGICMIIVGATGFLFSFFLARKMVLPIKNISDLVYSEVDNEMDSEVVKNDELGGISHAITNMNSRIQTMKTIIEDTNDDIIYINLMKMLNGEISSIDELNKSLVSTGIKLNLKYYTVAVFDLNIVLSSKTKMQGLTYLQEKNNEQNIHLFFLNSYESTYIYFIAMCDSPIVTINGFLAEQKRKLFKEFACDIFVGYSSGDYYFGDVSKNFYSSLLAFENKFVLGKNSIVDNNDIEKIIESSDNSFNYQEYYRVLLGGTKEEVITYISEYYLQISSKQNRNMHELKVKIFGIFNFLHDTFPMFVSKYQENVAILLEHYDTAEEFLNYICDISIYICDNLKKNTHQDKFLHINDFMNEHFHEDNFSIQLVADEFQMSVSTLSKYYKDIAGENISEAVNKLKINKAKELLANTDLTVNEIVLKIGYYNSSSFIRKFKEYTSVTPGRYRDKYKNKLNFDE